MICNELESNEIRNKILEGYLERDDYNDDNAHEFLKLLQKPSELSNKQHDLISLKEYEIVA